MAKLVVKGPGLAKELVYANTLGARTFDNRLIAGAVDELLALPVSQGVTTLPWSRGVFTPSSNITDRDDWIPALQGIFKFADALNLHTRFHPYLRKVDMSAFGVDSGVVLVNPRESGPLSFSTGAANVGYIDSIQIAEESSEQATIVIPLGQGEGAAEWTIKYSTRTTPYAVQSAVGPDGTPYYYLRDAAAATALGRDIIKPVSFKDVGPIANSALAFELASNALHDLGTTWLQRHKDTQATYDVKASKLEAASFQVGDLIRILFEGFVEDAIGTRRVWKSIDTMAVVLEKRREYKATGIPEWGLTLSTVARWRQSDEEIIVGAIETLQAFKTAIKPYTFVSQSGPVRESIQFSGSRWASLDVYISAEYRGLLKSTLHVIPRKLKSNVSTSSEDPAKSSTGGGSHSHSFSAGTSTGGGSSHSHAFSGFVEGPSRNGAVDNIYTGGPIRGGSSWDITGFTFPTNATEHQHDMQHHFHQLSGDSPEPAQPVHVHVLGGNVASAGESSHTHSLSGKTTDTTTNHSHTIPAHSHDLIYGIFESTLPSTLGLRVLVDNVDVTVALGGPWNATFDADISPYMTDSEGRPKWGTRTVEIRKASSSPDTIDVIFEVESLVISTALEPD